MGRAGAQANQRKHIRAAIDKRAPKTLEKWPATPQYNGSSEKKFDCVSDGWSKAQAEPFPKHGEDQHGQRQCRADPEPPPHRGIFGIGFHFRENIHRLGPRSADWAGAAAE